MFLTQGIVPKNRDPFKKIYLTCLGAWQTHFPINHHACDFKNKKQIKIDGWDFAHNTVYKFHGCYWLGCPVCFDQEWVVAQCQHVFKDNNNKKEVHREVRMQDFYAASLQKWRASSKTGTMLSKCGSMRGYNTVTRTVSIKKGPSKAFSWAIDPCRC